MLKIKPMKTHSIVLLLLLLTVSASAQKVPKTGRPLFESKCARCHGKDGAKGFFGAKNLQVSVLSDAMVFATISDGKSLMPSWKKKLSETQIRSLTDYIKTLRKI